MVSVKLWVGPRLALWLYRFFSFFFSKEAGEAFEEAYFDSVFEAMYRAYKKGAPVERLCKKLWVSHGMNFPTSSKATALRLARKAQWEEKLRGDDEDGAAAGRDSGR